MSSRRCIRGIKERKELLIHPGNTKRKRDPPLVRKLGHDHQLLVLFEKKNLRKTYDFLAARQVCLCAERFKNLL